MKIRKNTFIERQYYDEDLYGFIVYILLMYDIIWVHQ